MKKRPIWFLIIGIVILIVPSVTYLCILIPKMREEYKSLMSSGGVIATGGMYGASLIPEKVKFSALYKASARSFTLMTVIVLVQDFIPQIIGFVATFILSFIIFSFLKELYKEYKEKLKNAEFAKEIARNIIENSK